MMFETLTAVIAVLLLLVWVLDALGVLEIFSALFELLSAVVAAVLLLAAWAVRKLASSRKPVLPPPSPELPSRRGRVAPRGSGQPPTE